jgi:hypothetical protein
MDTSRPAVAEIASRVSQTGTTPKRQRRSVEEKRRIVEETLAEGASVARVARVHVKWGSASFCAPPFGLSRSLDPCSCCAVCLFENLRQIVITSAPAQSLVVYAMGTNY